MATPFDFYGHPSRAGNRYDTHNEGLLIHVFYDSLTGAAVRWYMKLKKDQIRTWRDLARAFLKRYKYLLK